MIAVSNLVRLGDQNEAANMRITANVITDKGIRVGPESTALNFQQIVSVS